ncbi:ATP-binding protein [bacterium]|nr:ATP-binding protein [bacterium]
MYQRHFQLNDIVDRKSVFLLGPRQTGKSTLLRTILPHAVFVDLLESETFRELSTFPESLRQRVGERRDVVVIDEVQKLPGLLDEVQLMIDRNKDLRFVLTGSSARKLKQGKANLLGGRALFLKLHPLVSPELSFERLLDRMNRGGLPAIIDSPFPDQDMNAYVGTYLKEEIQAEGATRSIENFSRVLNFASHLNGKQVNYTKVGNDAQVPPRTVKDYFGIFSDTMIAHLLPCFQGTSKRKPVSTEKFYFFDIGVARNLSRAGMVQERSEAFGNALEHLIFLELLAYRDYNLLDFELFYWRSRSQLEVDFLINDEIAIEVKGTSRVSQADLKGLKALSEELPLKRAIVVCSETEERKVGGIEIVPIDRFLRYFWEGLLI